MAEKSYAELETECSALRCQVHALKKLIEFDRTGLAKALGTVRGLVDSWYWIPAGEWGCYAWDERTEEAIRDEIGRCFDQIAEVATAALRESGRRVAAAFGDRHGLTKLVEGDDRPADAPPPPGEPVAARGRVPLASRRLKLVDYLTAHGPSLRATIIQATDIPSGSLSALLQDGGFKQLEDGRWGLAETVV
jgi:hypothetical protein